MYSILFVCSANMCRSPMAEGLFLNHLIQLDSQDDWYISSAGVWAIEGSRASDGAVKAMNRKGIDISQHRSRQVDREMINDSDLVLVMERNHKEAIRIAFPEWANKIYLLAEMVGLFQDIRDPIGGTAADYDDTANELEELIKAGFYRIHELVQLQRKA